jgi:hypothetical protein
MLTVIGECQINLWRLSLDPTFCHSRGYVQNSTAESGAPTDFT